MLNPPYGGCVFCCARDMVVDPHCLYPPTAGTQIFGTLLSLPDESRNSSVTFRDLRETHVGIFTFGTKLGLVHHNPSQDLLDGT